MLNKLSNLSIRIFLITLMFLFAAHSTGAQVATGGNYRLEQAVIGSGGATSINTSNKNVLSVMGTIGQSVTGTTSTASSFGVQSGFWTGFLLNPLTPTTTQLSSSANPSVFGQSVTFTASVAASGNNSVPSGSVIFTIDGTAHSTVALNNSGTASLTISKLNVSNQHFVSAAYSGDSSFAPSSAPSNLMQAVIRASSTTAIISQSAATTVVGEPFIISFSAAAISPGAGTPSGSITVSDPESNICTGVLSPSGTGSCTLTYSSAGARSLTAVFAGDTNFAGSTSASVSHSVNKANTKTAITGTPSSLSVVGQSISISYSVSVISPGSGTPTGTVLVSDGTNSCTGTVGAGSCRITSTAAGNKTLTAVYQGDNNFNASPSSTSVSYTVNKASTTTSITNDSPDPSVYGQAVTVNYSAAVNSPGAGTAGGNVTVSDGVNFCTGTVAAGTCTLTLNTIGARTLTAVYSGDANFLNSTSAGEPHTITEGSVTAPPGTVLINSISINPGIVVRSNNIGTVAISAAVSAGASANTASAVLYDIPVPSKCTGNTAACTIVRTGTQTVTTYSNLNINVKANGSVMTDPDPDGIFTGWLPVGSEGVNNITVNALLTEQQRTDIYKTTTTYSCTKNNGCTVSSTTPLGLFAAGAPTLNITSNVSKNTFYIVDLIAPTVTAKFNQPSAHQNGVENVKVDIDGGSAGVAFTANVRAVNSEGEPVLTGSESSTLDEQGKRTLVYGLAIPCSAAPGMYTGSVKVTGLSDAAGEKWGTIVATIAPGDETFKVIAGAELVTETVVLSQLDSGDYDLLNSFRTSADGKKTAPGSMHIGTAVSGGAGQCARQNSFSNVVVKLLIPKGFIRLQTGNSPLAHVFIGEASNGFDYHEGVPLIEVTGLTKLEESIDLNGNTVVTADLTQLNIGYGNGVFPNSYKIYVRSHIKYSGGLAGAVPNTVYSFASSVSGNVEGVVDGVTGNPLLISDSSSRAVVVNPAP